MLDLFIAEFLTDKYQVLMMICIYALYNRGRPILALLIVLWHATVIFNGVCIHLELK